MKEYYLGITGATSTIGLAIIHECILREKKVLAICGVNSTRRSLVPISPYVETIECDISDYVEYEWGERQVEVLIHLAWTSTKGDNARNQIKAHSKNVEYAIDAVELAHMLNASVYVGSGSQAEYGRTDEVLTELTECHPETPYGIAKLCAGQLTRLACRNYGIRHVWPRILSVYGLNCAPHTIIPYVMNELMKGHVPALSAGTQIWDFLYTSDVANAMLALADKGHDGEIYIVASGIYKPLKEYLIELRDIVAPNVDLGFGMMPYSSGMVMHLAADISKITKDTGFVPKYTFGEGIKEIIKVQMSKNII